MSTGVVATLPLQHQRRGRPPARSNTWLPARAPSRAAVCTCSASSGEGASAVAGAAGTAANCARSHLFVFGASGYTARALAGVLKRSGWRVSGACRGEETREALRAAGVEAHTWDPDDDVPLSRDALDCLRAATHVLSSVPPVGDFDRDPVLQLHGSDIAALAGGGRCAWVGYLSSTGVYGDHGGAWVDEDAPLRVAPGSGKLWARAEAERGWLRLGECHRLPVRVFRLAGIYGPGRSLLDTLRARGRESSAQRRREERPAAFVLRTHVADVCGALRASMAAPAAAGGRAVFNVADLDPAPRHVAAAFAAALLEGASPAAAAAAADQAAAARAPEPAQHGGGARGEKRVCSRRMREELGVRLLFPTYREGLAAIAAGDLRPFGAAPATAAREEQ